MALLKGDKLNFATLLRAAASGDLALVESRDRAGHYVALVCAMADEGEGVVVTTPLACMNTGNPYEDYADPTQPELPKAVPRPSDVSVSLGLGDDVEITTKGDKQW